LSSPARLAGFLVLLVAVFAGAHAAGARLGPVTTGHSHVQYAGRAGSGPGGMTMVPAP
jgi:hypothetical protein